MSTTEINKITKEISVQLTLDELSIINNSLNEVLELFYKNDEELTIRIGESKIKVEELLSKINLLYKNNIQ